MRRPACDPQWGADDFVAHGGRVGDRRARRAVDRAARATARRLAREPHRGVGLLPECREPGRGTAHGRGGVRGGVRPAAAVVGRERSSRVRHQPRHAVEHVVAGRACAAARARVRRRTPHAVRREPHGAAGDADVRGRDHRDQPGERRGAAVPLLLARDRCGLRRRGGAVGDLVLGSARGSSRHLASRGGAATGHHRRVLARPGGRRARPHRRAQSIRHYAQQLFDRAAPAASRGDSILVRGVGPTTNGLAQGLVDQLAR